MIVAGIGCRRACPAEDIVAVLRAAEDLAGVAAQRLAAPAFKADSAGLVGAAQRMGLALVLVEDAEMQKVQSQCRTFSDVAQARLGYGAVAEAAALAAAGPGAVLRLARIKGASATCALAESAGA